jgi:hypothetical protein
MFVDVADAARRHGVVVLMVTEENVALPEFPAAEWTKSWQFDPQAISALSSSLSFDFPLGDVTTPDEEIYVCPYGDYRWSRRGAGVPVVDCPNHHVPLVRE